jgi:hypothetical protein
MKKILSIFLLCLISAAVFSEGMSSRSVGNNSKYPSNVVQTPDGFAQVKGFSNATQRTTATALGYTDDQAGSTAYKTALADTANAANCQAAYGKPCGQLTKTEYTAVLTMQSQTLSVSASPSSLYSGGGTATLTTTGNQSTVTYTASGPCTVSGSTVTASNTAGTCTITANAPAALPSYKAAAPTPFQITINPLLTQSITLSADASSIAKGETTAVRSAGYQAGYSPTYTASSGCSIVNTQGPAWTVTAGNSTGTCTITATAPANGNYAQWTGTINITITGDVSRCFVVDFTNNNYNPTCGSGNRVATFAEMQKNVCQSVAFTWRGSSSVYLQGSNGRFIRHGVGYPSSWTIATFSSGASSDSYGKSGNSFSLGSTEAVVCVTP